MRYKAIIFDVDQTLVDTTALEEFRSSHQWETCYKNFSSTIRYPDDEDWAFICNNRKIGIVTNSLEEYAQKLLRHHNITYHALFGYHDLNNILGKPYPDRLLACMEELAVSVDECLYVGDNEYDITAAKMAGCNIVLYCPEKDRVLDYLSQRPDGIVANYSELVDYIKEKENNQKKRYSDTIYEKAILAKEANKRQYFELLREAAKLGSDQAQYKMANILRKNPQLIKEDEEIESYLWESVKQYNPRSIYLLGHSFYIRGEYQQAQKLFRIAANEGIPEAQVHFAELLEKDTVDWSHRVALHWLEKARTNKFLKNENRYKQLRAISELENELSHYFSFSREHGVYFFDIYVPKNENRKENYDYFSQQILNLKSQNKDAIDSFYSSLKDIRFSDEILCYVPSSTKNKTETGIRKLVRKLCPSPFQDTTDCLVRTTSIEKSSRGGERSLDIHLNSLEVRNKEKIIGKHVLLFDDVVTTGYSLEASKQLLLDAGADHVTKVALGKTKNH